MHNFVHKCWLINDDKSNLSLDIQYCKRTKLLIPGVARSKAARLLGLWFRIPPRHGCVSVVSVVCCHLEVSVLVHIKYKFQSNTTIHYAKYSCCVLLKFIPRMN